MSGQEVILEHNCPVCKYTTTEFYMKSVYRLSLQAVYITHYDFLREQDDKSPFARWRKNTSVYLIYPKCGVVLSGDICEREIDEEPV